MVCRVFLAVMPLSRVTGSGSGLGAMHTHVQNHLFTVLATEVAKSSLAQIRVSIPYLTALLNPC